MSSTRKVVKPRRTGIKSETMPSKKGPVTGPENGLVKWLHSQSTQQKSSPSDAEHKTNANSGGQKQKIGKKRVNNSVKDDATRIKMRVRYLLNIIMREQNFIDAYSGDGWKGQSLEKIRPEQELKRAETQILQTKIKIRQELQQLDTLSLEGSIQESAFEPDGQIFFDDIFCALCKSKEVYPENDIILCDGACNRAFHQFCLDPPLRTEDIPQGDDGWLCPACDCKFDCLDVINDNFGTDFQIEDSWEKVFAEVEDAGAGDNNFGSQVDWPSEDSEDDDYNPETPKPLEPRVGGEKTGSDDELGPDSGSDDELGSDSDSDSSEGSEVEFFDEFAVGSRSKKSHLFEDDKLENVEDDTEADDDAAVVTGKRQRPDVDYKQLYDAVYGANASDYDSEDEDYGKKKQSKNSKESESANSELVIENPSEVKDGQDAKETGGSQRKSWSRLPKEVVLKLRETFKESELPSKASKHMLASELGVPFKTVNTWFKNARHASAKKKKPREEEEDGQQACKQDSALSATTGSEAVDI